METVKESGAWSSLGCYGCHVFSILASVFTLVVKHGIMKFWLKFGLKGQNDSSSQTIMILTGVFFVSVVQMLWSWPVWVTIYRADKLRLDTRIKWRAHGQTDVGNDNTRRPELASGNNRAESNNSLCIHGCRNVLVNIPGSHVSFFLSTNQQWSS